MGFAACTPHRSVPTGAKINPATRMTTIPPVSSHRLFTCIPPPPLSIFSQARVERIHERLLETLPDVREQSGWGAARMPAVKDASRRLSLHHRGGKSSPTAYTKAAGGVKRVLNV